MFHIGITINTHTRTYTHGNFSFKTLKGAAHATANINYKSNDFIFNALTERYKFIPNHNFKQHTYPFICNQRGSLPPYIWTMEKGFNGILVIWQRRHLQYGRKWDGSMGQEKARAALKVKPWEVAAEMRTTSIPTATSTVSEETSPASTA